MLRTTKSRVFAVSGLPGIGDEGFYGLGRLGL